MSDLLLNYGVSSYVSRDILVVPFQSDFYSEVMHALSKDIAQQIHEHPEIKGVIIDLSKINLIDKSNMRMLEETLEVAAVLGVQGYISGIQPPVTLALLDLGYNPEKLNTALNIAQASNLIHEKSREKEIGSDSKDYSEEKNDENFEEQLSDDENNKSEEPKINNLNFEND